MHKKLNLVFWAARENYGDYLSPFLVHHLTGLDIRQIDVAYLQKPWKTIIREFLSEGALNDIRFSHRFPRFEKNYVCVGSILGQGNKHSHYWGTGYISPPSCLRNMYNPGHQEQYMLFGGI